MPSLPSPQGLGTWLLLGSPAVLGQAHPATAASCSSSSAVGLNSTLQLSVFEFCLSDLCDAGGMAICWRLCIAHKTFLLNLLKWGLIASIAASWPGVGHLKRWRTQSSGQCQGLSALCVKHFPFKSDPFYCVTRKENPVPSSFRNFRATPEEVQQNRLLLGQGGLWKGGDE